MDNLSMDESILHYLYTKSFAAGDATLESLDLWAVHLKFDMNVFWEHYNQLIKQGWVLPHHEDNIVRLTPQGVLRCEKAGLAHASLIAKNRDMRKRFVHTLADQAAFRGTTITIDELLEYSDEEENYCLGNIELLISLGYVKWIIPKVNLSINMNVCAKEAALSRAQQHS